MTGSARVGTEFEWLGDMTEPTNRSGRPTGAEERARAGGESTNRSAPAGAMEHVGGGTGRGVDGFGFMMDVPVVLTVELGRRNVKIGEVLRLGPGSVLELNKSNGEPLDIYVNNRLIARGEAVVVGERYGVRLTDVVIGEASSREDGQP